MSARTDQIDRTLLIVVVLLALLGMYNLTSAGRPISDTYYVNHLMHLGLGGFLAALVARTDYRRLESLAGPLFVLMVGLLFVTAFSGKVVNGSRRWLDLGAFNLQTSDLAKLAMVVALAAILRGERFEPAGLTIREVFRPFNLSRPLLLLLVCLLVVVLGDFLRTSRLQQTNGRRFRTVLSISSSRPNITLGKSTKATHTVNLSGVEPLHAEIVRESRHAYRLHVLAKDAATFVNDQKISETVPLHDGDEIQLGLSQRARFRFRAPVLVLRRAVPWLVPTAFVWLGVSLFLFFRQRRRSFRDWVAPIDLVAVPAAMILLQPDLGTTIVIILIAFSMLVYVGFKWRSLLLLITLSTVFAAVAWQGILEPYQKERVLTFLNPSEDLAGSGYHQHQSLIAIGSGRFFGKGHGQGTQTQFSFVPEQQTDFVAAVWAEEHGFLGASLMTALFLAFVVQSLRVAQQARDRFGSLLGVGMAAMIFWHAVINLAMVLRLLPVVGVPLPLWSSGGSFVVTSFLAIGVIFSVSMRRMIF